MKFFSLKLKQKILSVIILVLAVVMVVSSLVVSYVIYNQNVASTHTQLTVAVNNIRNKIGDIQEDYVKKIIQMNSVFKVGDNVKFIIDFKQKFDLTMTENSFSELTNAVFATSAANNLDKLAIYDINGELIAFSQKETDNKRMIGFYYVHPEKEFRVSRLGDNDDSEKNTWETVKTIDDLRFEVQRKDLTSKDIIKSIQVTGSHLSLNVVYPVMVEDYNKETDKMEPKLFGFVELSKNLDAGFVDQAAELTGMAINIFKGTDLSAGNLNAYKSLSGVDLPQSVSSAWTLKDQPVVLGEVKTSDGNYLEGVLPVYNGTSRIGAITALTSSQSIMDNTLQVVYVLITVFVCCLVLIVPIALFVSGTITKSLVVVTESLKDVAQGEGDLTKRIEITTKDEIGELSQWFNTFVENLQVMIKDISGGSRTISGLVSVASKEAGDISDNAGGMLDITRDISNSTTQMSQSISSIAEVMNQSSDNLGLVASSTEEMTATINEIAKNAENARAMSLDTGGKIDKASGRIDQLERDAKEIDAFTESINEISEQTNLLALNATIEAARAGEAGKGFAVVAGEIKELARQTAKATQDIKDKVDNIRNSTEMTITEMSGISTAFGQMNDVVNDIASAIEEQSVTTKEIAQNTTSVSDGINDVNSSITEFDALTTEIAQDMNRVNDATTRMFESCGKIDTDTGEMSGQTQILDNLINKFKID